MEQKQNMLSTRYRALLDDYLHRGGDRALQALQVLSGEFVRSYVGPEAVVAMHERALAEIFPTFPTAQVPEIALRSMTFLARAMRPFGLDPLQPYLEAAVTNRFVAQVLHDLEAEFHLPPVARAQMGRKYAQNFEGDLTNYLDTFRLQGLGQITLESVDEETGEVVFTGRGLFESYERADCPQDHFARGFLAEAVSRLVGRPMNCEEMSCQAQGASACHFVVSPVAPGPIPNLRQLLEGG